MKYAVICYDRREEYIGDFEYQGDVPVNDEIKIKKREFIVKKRRFSVVDGNTDTVELLCTELLF